MCVCVCVCVCVCALVKLCVLAYVLSNFQSGDSLLNLFFTVHKTLCS